MKDSQTMCSGRVVYVCRWRLNASCLWALEQSLNLNPSEVIISFGPLLRSALAIKLMHGLETTASIETEDDVWGSVVPDDDNTRDLNRTILCTPVILVR